MLAYAEEAAHITAAKSWVFRLEKAILFPLMAFMMVVALLVFLYGVYEYVLHADDSRGREEGRKHMMFGIIGMFVMLSAMSILTLAANTFGVTVPTP